MFSCALNFNKIANNLLLKDREIVPKIHLKSHTCYNDGYMASLSVKRILTDIAGYSCLVAAPLIGWLPGPGGIPLFLTGLGLLSINNEWAKRLRHYVSERSQSLSTIFFPDKSVFQWSWDIFVIILLFSGTLISIYSENNFVRASSVAFYASASTIFLLNRRRLQWLDKKLRRHTQ